MTKTRSGGRVQDHQEERRTYIEPHQPDDGPKKDRQRTNGDENRKPTSSVFTADIHNLFAQQAKTKSISLKFRHDSDTLNVWIDRGNFDKVR